MLASGCKIQQIVPLMVIKGHHDLGVGTETDTCRVGIQLITLALRLMRGGRGRGFIRCVCVPMLAPRG